MPSSPNGAATRETIIPTEAANIPAGSTSPNQRKMWRFWSGACFVIVLLAAFAQPLLVLIIYAAGSQLYSYILLVPFVSAYLLYLRRDQLPKKYLADPWLAIVSLAAGLSILVFTYWMDFVVPMPDAMADALETASKYASAEVANLFFHLSRMPFLRAGLIFQLPNITIEVAQECSGIRSSWVLFMTSILAANLFLKTRWRRFALVAFVIPLAMLRNGFRILVIGLLCVTMGPQMIHSLIHRRGGPLFFMLSLIPFFLVLWWLRKGDVRTRQPE